MNREAAPMWSIIRRFMTRQAAQVARHVRDESLVVSRARIDGRTGNVVFLADDGTPVTSSCPRDFCNE